MSILTKYPNRAALFGGLAHVVAGELRAALHSKGKASLAVPGGTTPAPFFKILRDADLDWAHVSIMLTDERFVPETSDRSNTRLLRENMLQGRAASAQMVPFYLPADTPETVLQKLTKGIEPALPLDVCVLGMGADMHTASLFPGADLLDCALAPDAPVLLAMRAAGAPEPRLTLTAPVLQNAAQVHILITGPAKRDAFSLATQAGPVAQAPIRIVLNRKRPTTAHYAD